jgi:ankyrin repeat protein
MQQELIDAVEAGDTEAIRALLRRRPDLASGRDESGLSLVLLALFRGQRQACDALLETEPEIGVLEAAALGRSERLRELLASEPDALGARTPEGFDPIGLAAFLGGPAAVRVLLEHGADPNGDPRNALRVRPVHAAAAAHDRESLRLLLEAGADPDARQQAGFTPLHAAGHSDDPEMAALLLEHGADPALRTDDGLDAAALSERDGSGRVARLLLKARVR